METKLHIFNLLCPKYVLPEVQIYGIENNSEYYSKIEAPCSCRESSILKAVLFYP
jgi:hypothetical protein